MHIRGRLRHDAPDPALDVIEQVKRMPVPVFGLVAQRHLEDWDAFGWTALEHDGVLESCEASISYTLWRNPEYIDDPANLADLDDETRARLEHLPPDRPRWLIERTRRMTYPLLWDCVTTHWSAAPHDGDRVEQRLAAHVNHVLINRFRGTRVRGGVAGDLDSPVDERHAEHDVPIRVNGYWRSGIRIDTDPDVCGVGVALDRATSITAVVPRDELRFVDLAFATRRL
jgi:hypothetical protein